MSSKLLKQKIENKKGYYDIFLNSCSKYSSNIAVRLYNNDLYETFTYSELFGVCEYLCQILQQYYCSKNIIGIISSRNVIIPCIIAAAHKCCNTFMFLDPCQPVENVIASIKIDIIISITEKDVKFEINGKGPEKAITIFNCFIKFYSFNHKSNNEIIEHSYIASTSGSTGDPKYILVPLQCLQPNIDDLTKIFDITSKDIIYFSTPLTFDPSMIEILLACINGASLLIAPENVDILFPDNKEHSITFWQTTPSKFLQISSLNINDKVLSASSTLKILALGGEPLNAIKRLKQLKHENNKTRLFTLYGVTEMSCWACVAELDLSKIVTEREIPLGNCLSETEITIEPFGCEINNVGKILLSSKTRKCMVLNQCSSSIDRNSIKIIDTGDLAEVRNGNIYYSGRRDDTIKRFGHKVNLLKIEAAIMQCPEIKTCSCIWLPKPMLLVVYFSSEIINSQELSNFLKGKLDDKHWPDKIVRVNNLPTNKHGKISKLTLTKIFEESSDGHQQIDSIKVVFLNELNTTLNSKFTHNYITNKEFFSLGGTSFLAVSMCNKISNIHSQLGKKLLPYLLTQSHTIGEVIKLLQKEVSLDEYNKTKCATKRTSDDLNDNSYNKRVTHKVESRNKLYQKELRVLWKHDTGKCVDASPALFTFKNSFYTMVGSHSGKVIVVEGKSGELKGTIKLKTRVEAAILCFQESNGSEPKGVVGGYDGTIICFIIEGCKILWKINIGAMIKSKAVFYKGLIYVAAYDGNIRCINSMTGNITKTTNISEQAISADLIFTRHENIMVGTLSGICAGFHGPTNSLSWQNNLGSPVFASPVVYDNEQYVIFVEVGGGIHCWRTENGIKIWKYQGITGNIFSSIRIKQHNDLNWQIIFGCHDSNVYSMMIKNFEPSIHWKTKVSSPVYATPCSLTDQLLLVASNNGMLYVIDWVRGSIMTEFSLPGETFSSAAVYGDNILIGCRNNYLFCLKYDTHR